MYSGGAEGAPALASSKSVRAQTARLAHLAGAARANVALLEGVQYAVFAVTSRGSVVVKEIACSDCRLTVPLKEGRGYRERRTSRATARRCHGSL